MKPEIGEQVLELLDSLNEGIIYVEQSDHVAHEVRLQVLQNCLNCILPMEKSMVNVGGENGKRAISLLRVLEKQIEKIQRALENHQALKVPTLMIKKQILKIKGIITRSNTKKEIVFLPYKVSMWDSLESIWRAAFEDENCCTFVIPIPYCDRNPDGSAAEWHYEGKELPSYVPVVDWEKYDLAKRRPDVIYIHNPYDGCNRVTSVHPNYYSGELKKYTDMLVYVPYFVSGEIVGSNVCQMPGIVNADRVILESEIVKSQYEAYYPNRNPPKNKFLALGSPKFDKVKDSKKEQFFLPEKWQRMVQGKKIILYLTTIGTMLERPENFIAKHRYVFSVFRDRKDIVLWWRPHPLLKSTFESMRPEFIEAYGQLEQEFKSNGWGIYDDSTELNRAITWSDAYYGDMSSVTWLYKATGKPIMIQSLKYEDGMFFDYIEPDGDDIWFIPVRYNALFKMSLADGKIELVGEFPGEKLFADRRYRTLMRVDDKIIIIPYFSDKVIEYDIDKRCFNHYLIEVHETHAIAGYWKYNNLLIGMAKYKQYIFMFGFQPVIVRYDMKSHEFSYFNDWVNSVDIDYARSKGLMWREHCIKENLLFIAILRTNKIVVFDMETCVSDVRIVGGRESKYSQIYYDGEYFWLLHSNNVSLTRWRLETNEVLEYSVGNEVARKNDVELAMRGMLLCGENLYVIPGQKKVALKIDAKSYTFNLLQTDIFCEDDNRKSEFKLYCDCSTNHGNEQILLMKSSDCSLTVVDADFNVKRTYRMMLSNSVYDYIVDKSICMDNMVKESRFEYGLLKFIDILNKGKENFCREPSREPKGFSIHKKIYDDSFGVRKCSMTDQF